MELYNAAAERAVLSGILKGGIDAYTEVEDVLRTEFFFLESSQATWKCIKKIYEEQGKVDITSILSSAKEVGIGDFFSEKSNLQYLRSLTQLDISPENIRKEGTKVAKLAIARVLCDKCDEAKKDLCKVNGSESLSSIIGIYESKLADLSLLDDSTKTEKMGEGGEAWLQNILDNPDKEIGVSTGYGIFDGAIGGGIRRKTVALIAARMKTGKSALTDSVSIHVAGQLGIPVLNLDTEMNREDHLARICANLTGIPINRIERGQLSKAEGEKLKETVKYIKSIPYFYRCVAGYEFLDILSIIRRWVKKDVGTENGRTKDCLIVYDYFKLMNSDALKSVQEYQELGFQMSTLTNFAIKHDVPVLTFAQTNRDGATEDTVETIAASDRLGWFASSVSVFKKKSVQEIGQDGIENGNRKLVPLAARYGPCLDEGDYIHMNMRGEFCKITELGTRNETWKKKKQEEKQEQGDSVAF